MSRQRIDTLIPEAYQAIEKCNLSNKGEVDKMLRSQISAFGAAVTVGSLINEYGRRIYCPYIYDVKNLKSSLTADSIHLEGAAFSSGGSEDEWRITADADDEEKMPKAKLAKVVTMLLTNGSISVTNIESETCNDRLYIEPIIDDRMFVACIVQDQPFIDRMAEWNGSEYSWLSDALEKETDAIDSVARQLYEFVFVDTDKNISCRDRQQLHRLLEKHIYTRWIEFGTIYGVTEYSIMACVSKEDSPFVVGPFLTQYIELAILALAQRASLIAFERQISRVSRNFKKTRDMMQAYVCFQSQLLLTEVTPQQQGIELYDMLLENLYINKEKDEVESRIRSLFDLKNFRSDRIENKILFAIAVLGVVSTIDILLRWFGVI